MQPVAQLLRELGVDDAERLAALAERSWRITYARSAIALGASRLGGAPDVPADFDWPMCGERPLSFLAQLDLADVASPELPPRGWLLFFYDADLLPFDFDPNDVDPRWVRYLEVDRATLRRREQPGSPAFAAQLTLVIDLPGIGDSVLEHAGLEVEDDVAYDTACQRLSQGEEHERYFHLLGHPQLIQDDMRLDASAQWRLLLQLDSDGEGLGWMWGDMGRLYFWIRRDDLAARNFDRVCLATQCY